MKFKFKRFGRNRASKAKPSTKPDHEPTPESDGELTPEPPTSKDLIVDPSTELDALIHTGPIFKSLEKTLDLEWCGAQDSRNDNTVTWEDFMDTVAFPEKYFDNPTEERE